MKPEPVFLIAVLISAGALSLALIAAALPWLRSYALAHPNSRSSHREPVPQGGGAAVVLSTFVVGWCALVLAGPFAQSEVSRLLVLTGAGALLAVLGAIDDARGLSPLPRLAAQCIAVGAVIASISDQPIVPFLPWWLERAVLFVGGVWFVNLTNFMDGIDWMTVAEVVPIAGAIVVVGWFGLVPPSSLLIAAALLGAILGFAPFNRPVAKLFLGDVGSLPIGLVLAWLLLQLVAKGYLAAAILLPLYYVADATLTLLWRLWHGEPLWQAHRSHFYQHAFGGGLAVTRIIARVFVVNLALVGLALTSIWRDDIFISAGTVAAGGLIVGALLWNLSAWGSRTGATTGDQAASPRKSGTASRKTE